MGQASSQTAEHAAAHVEVEFGEHLLFGLGITLAADLDEILRTSQGTGSAGGAKVVAVLVLQQPRHSAVALGDLRAAPADTAR